MRQEISWVIEKSKKVLDKDFQKAELLIRNKKFMNERSKIFSELGMDFFRELKRVHQSLFTTMDYPPDTPHVFMGHKRKWEKFCFRWDIGSFWNGQRSTLAKFVNPSVMAAFRPEPEKITKGFLLIKINASTTLQDIRNVWPNIERLQKIWLSKKVELKTNFSRDLCWYDLSKKFNLTTRQIAKLWTNKFPEDIDLIIIRRLKKDKLMMKEVKEAIETDEELKELRGRFFEDKELLYEFKGGKLARKFGSYFKKEKEFYIHGQTDRGKFTPPLIAVVKQAVRRMQKYIDQIEVKHTPSPDIYKFYINSEIPLVVVVRDKLPPP